MLYPNAEAIIRYGSITIFYSPFRTENCSDIVESYRLILRSKIILTRAKKYSLSTPSCMIPQIVQRGQLLNLLCIPRHTTLHAD